MIKIGLMVLLLGMSHVVCAELTVTVKPQSVHVDQEIQLVIRQQGVVSSHDMPDLSVLRQDFQILGTQQSMAYQVLNGISQHESMWTILLLPKHTGKIVIPSFAMGGEHSHSQVIDVLPAKVSNSTSNVSEKNVFMTWELEPSQVFLHEELKIKLHVYHAVPLLDAKLSLPSIENGLLFPVETSQHQVQFLHGKQFEIESYTYLVFPQKTGSMVLYPPSLDALEYDVVPNPIHIQLVKKVIDVKPQNLIPLKQFRYQESTPNSSLFKIGLGDTVSRKIKIQGIGLPYQMLPDLQTSCGSDCKVYVHTKQAKNLIKNGDIWGSKVFELTYLPRRQGAYRLPDIRLFWLNTKTRKMETLIIPGMDMQVGPAMAHASVESASAKLPEQSIWQLPTWVAAMLGLFMGIGIMRYWYYFSWNNCKRGFQRLVDKNYHLKQACLQNTPVQARIALMTWARKTFPEKVVVDLQDVIDLVDNVDLKSELLVLSQALYAAKAGQETWQGARLWAAFKRFRPKKRTSVREKNTWNRLNPE